METVLTGEPIPKVDPILVLEPVLEMDPIPQIPIPAQNTVIPCPILIPTKNGIKTSLIVNFISKGSLSHLRTMLPEGKQPAPACPTARSRSLVPT